MYRLSIKIIFNLIIEECTKILRNFENSPCFKMYSHYDYKLIEI
jgi:hypothetical protein